MLYDPSFTELSCDYLITQCITHSTYCTSTQHIVIRTYTNFLHLRTPSQIHAHIFSSGCAATFSPPFPLSCFDDQRLTRNTPITLHLSITIHKIMHVYNHHSVHQQHPESKIFPLIGQITCITISF